MEKHFCSNGEFFTPKSPYLPGIDLEFSEKILMDSHYDKDYLNLKKYSAASKVTLPPLLKHYIKLSPSLKFFGAVKDHTLGNSILLGDINGDNQINIQDIIFLINYILDLELPNDNQFSAADINEDGILNIQDVILILNIILS